jgi:hypothetical protein
MIKNSLHPCNFFLLQVRIADSALSAAATLSDRYITDRCDGNHRQVELIVTNRWDGKLQTGEMGNHRQVE